jgi:hypothetical protein
MRDAGRQGTGRFLKLEIEQEAIEKTEKRGLFCFRSLRSLLFTVKNG